MPEESTPSAGSVQVSLRELVTLMREGHRLDPAAQKQLADLVAELSGLVGRSEVPSAEIAHLVDSTTHLARSLRQPHSPGVLAAARDRLRDATARAEAQAPGTTLLARQLIETLANLGI
jgi:hypothetical protein